MQPDQAVGGCRFLIRFVFLAARWGGLSNVAEAIGIVKVRQNAKARQLKVDFPDVEWGSGGEREGGRCET